MAKITLESKKEIAPNISMFWFSKPFGYEYLAGQAAEFILPHDEDIRGRTRWFTLSSSPTENQLAITTRVGKSSFKNKLFSLKHGDELDILPAMGDYVLPRDASIPIVFIAGGIGVTPVRSIVKWLIDCDEKRELELLHVVSDKKDLVFHDIFASYGMKTTSLNGRESVENITLKTHTSKTMYYVSGPDEFIEATKNYLKSQDIDPTRIVPDFFTGY